MMSFTQDFNFRMHHKGNIQKKAKDAIDLYKGFEQVWMSDKDRIDRMANTNGDRAAVARYIGDGEQSYNQVYKGERWAGKLLNAWQEDGEPTNHWRLYNNLTNIASHHAGHDYSSKLNLMSKINLEAERWPKLLAA
jgi:aldehyde:ferredoxin oxidoreductase